MYKRQDMSKAELAEAIGTIPETISRMIARLKTRGVVSWERAELKIDVEYAKSVIEKVKVE